MAINLIPASDWIDHTSGTTCPCHPIIQIECDKDGQPIENSAIIIHRIVDPEQRERMITHDDIRTLRIRLMHANLRFLIVSVAMVLYSLWNIWFR